MLPDSSVAAPILLAPPSGARSLSAWLRRHRAWTLICTLFAAGLAVTLAAQLAPRGDSADLSIQNPAPEGAMAVAEILGRHGVNVEQSNSFADAESSLAASPGATVLLYDRNGYLDGEQLRKLREANGRLVVVTPRLNTLTGLGGEIHQAGVVPTSASTLEPECGVPEANAAGNVSADSSYLYTGGITCYRHSETSGGLYASADAGQLVVLGSTGIVSNRLLDEEGNAALVLQTLGVTGDLLWYLPSLADLNVSGSPKTLDDLAPAWVSFLGPWLLFVAILAIIWRGRRLGPLVFEPLPVTVKAIETAEGRARLYQDAHAVDRAAGNLRAGTLTRLAHTLRLGPEATAKDVVDATARFLGQPSVEALRLLDARPHTEAELVHWAQKLNTLENEVSDR